MLNVAPPEPALFAAEKQSKVAEPALRTARATRMTRMAATAVFLALFLAGVNPTYAQFNTSPYVRVPLHGRYLPPVGVWRAAFSPNGLYILAQDRNWITVLTVEPFGILFRAPSHRAISFAEFTPDSLHLLFVSSSRRSGGGPPTVREGTRQLLVTDAPILERWSIDDGTRIEVTDMPWQAVRYCETARLSPDGRMQACVDPDGTLRLIELPSGEVIFGKENFAREYVYRDGEFLRYEGDPGSAWIVFSPDGRFVVAWPGDASGAGAAFDRYERRVVNLEGELRRLRGQVSVTFAFAGSKRGIISTYVRRNPTVRAKVVTFPSGQVLFKPRVPPGPLHASADTSFVLVHPFGRDRLYSLRSFTSFESFKRALEEARRSSPASATEPYVDQTAAVEFSTGQVIISSTPALAVFAKHYVAEVRKGELGLYERGRGLLSSVKLEAPETSAR